MSIFTQRHYEWLARTVVNSTGLMIAEGLPDPGRIMRSHAKYLAATLEADNPRFDRDKFLRACGMTTEPQKRARPRVYAPDDKDYT